VKESARRLSTGAVLLVVWTMLGVAGAYWGYRDVMASCPGFDDFSGCFEPPYRLAASVILLPWAAVEVGLIVVSLGVFSTWGRRRDARQGEAPTVER
jgi:hypothetical protein